MSGDVDTGFVHPDPRMRLTQLAWRAELLVDVKEKTEEVACRVEGRAYTGPGPEVAGAREEAGRLKDLADRHAGDDLDGPAAMADLEESLVTATTFVRDLEDRGTPGVDPADGPHLPHGRSGR
jgi:hypothetical protein